LNYRWNGYTINPNCTSSKFCNYHWIHYVVWNLYTIIR